MSNIPKKKDIFPEERKSNIPLRTDIFPDQKMPVQAPVATEPTRGQGGGQFIRGMGQDIKQGVKGAYDFTKEAFGTVIGGASALFGGVVTAPGYAATGDKEGYKRGIKETYEFGKQIGKAPFDIAEEVVKTGKAYTSGDQEQIFNRIAEGYQRSADLGTYVTKDKPVDIEEAKQHVLDSNLAAAIGIINNIWDAYIFARPAARGTQEVVKNLPYVKATPTGEVIVIPAETAIKTLVAEQLNRAGFKRQNIIKTGEGVEVITTSESIKFTPENINVKNVPAGDIAVERMQRTPFARVTEPLSKITETKAPSRTTFIPAKQVGEPPPPTRGIGTPSESATPAGMLSERGTVSEKGFMFGGKEQQKLITLETELARLENQRKQIVTRTKTKFQAQDVIEIKNIDKEIEKMTKQVGQAKKKVKEGPKEEPTIPIEKEVQSVRDFLATDKDIGRRPQFTEADETALARLENSRIALKGEELDNYIELKEKQTASIEPSTKVETTIQQRLEAQKPIPLEERGVKPTTDKEIEALSKISDPAERAEYKFEQRVKEGKMFKGEDSYHARELKVQELMDKGLSYKAADFVQSWYWASHGAKPQITRDIVEEFKDYKPDKPITLYRGFDRGVFDEKGGLTRDFTSWTPDLDTAKGYLDLSWHIDSEITPLILKATFRPEDILVDLKKMLPDKMEHEIIAKPSNIYDIEIIEISKDFIKKLEGIYDKEYKETGKIPTKTMKKMISAEVDRLIAEEGKTQRAQPPKGVKRGQKKVTPTKKEIKKELAEPEIKVEKIVPLKTATERAYRKELEEMDKKGTTVDDFIKLELEEYQKGIAEAEKAGAVDKSGIIQDYINEKFANKLPSEDGMVLQSKLGLNILSDIIHKIDDIWDNLLGKRIASGLEAGLTKITPAKLKELLEYGYGRPEVWNKLQTQVKVDRNKMNRDIGLLTKRLAKLKPEELKLIRPIIESGMFDLGSMDRSTLLKLMPPGAGKEYQRGVGFQPPEHVIDLARDVTELFFKMGEELVRQNLLKPEQFAKYASKYYPRFYEIFNKNNQQFTYWFKKRLGLEYTFPRKDLSESIMESLGLIEDSPEPIAKRMIQEAGDIAMQRMFTAAAQMPNISSDTRTVEFTEMVPKSKKYGAMQGRYVNKYVLEDIEGLMDIPNKADTTFRTLWSTWKLGKVVINPATVSRNVMTNFWLADIAGNLPPEDIATWVSATKDALDYFYRGKEPADVVALVNQGVVGTEFWLEEIHGQMSKWMDQNMVKMKEVSPGVYEPPSKVQSIIPTIFEGLNKFMEKAGEFYNMLEVVSKVAVYKKNIELGRTPEEAGIIAENALFNYGKITPFIRQLRSGGGRGPIPQQLAPLIAMPFVTFKYKVYPLLLKSMIHKPFTWMKWLAYMATITEFARQAWGLSKEEVKKMQKRLGERTGRYVIPTGMKGETDEAEMQYYFLDFTYLFPGQDFLEIKQAVDRQDPKDMVRAVQVMQNPLANIVAAVATNRDPYFGSELVTEFDTPADALGKYMHYTYNQTTPTIISTYGAGRLFRAATGKPTRWGETESLSSSILSSIFGLKQIPYVESIQDSKTYSTIKYLENAFYKEIYKIKLDKSLTEKQQLKKVEKLIKQYEEKVEQEVGYTK